MVFRDYVVHQLISVLRVRPGYQIVVLDNSGWEHVVELERVSRQIVQGRITKKILSRGETEFEVVLYQAVLKANKFDAVLRKGTELGVSKFVPVFCERSVPKYRVATGSTMRNERWWRIVSEAAEQSRRGKLPVVESAVNFSEACDLMDGLSLIPWEKAATGLKEVLVQRREERKENPVVSIFTGPEGGFTCEEIDYACENGITPVSLGHRILRAETAPIATISAILYEFGELGE